MDVPCTLNGHQVLLRTNFSVRDISKFMVNCPKMREMVKRSVGGGGRRGC